MNRISDKLCVGDFLGISVSGGVDDEGTIGIVGDGLTDIPRASILIILPLLKIVLGFVIVLLISITPFSHLREGVD